MFKAIYPGTFDPFTLGHLNILEKACRIFDQVILAVADYTGKENLFNLQERYELCKKSTEHLPNAVVSTFQGLFVNYAKSQNCRIMIRGMRAVS
ncbi:MAG: pantetheine-phosphate adenylyltransferase, partial [Candidatus Cloacimonas sp.]